ncbi:MAG: hypothetical protein HW387_81 [Parachlamydiales bacterium]|nr:hypothetical protein [Parachlamydiales bacterium]
MCGGQFCFDHCDNHLMLNRLIEGSWVVINCRLGPIIVNATEIFNKLRSIGACSLEQRVCFPWRDSEDPNRIYAAATYDSFRHSRFSSASQALLIATAPFSFPFTSPPPTPPTISTRPPSEHPEAIALPPPSNVSIKIHCSEVCNPSVQVNVAVAMLDAAGL